MDEFPLRFERPLLLLLLLLLPVAWQVARHSLAGLPPVRRRVALALRLLLLALLSIACAGPQGRSPADRVAVAWLLDWSDSVPVSPPDLRAGILRYVTEASAARRKDDLVGLVYFGADATVETPPSPLPPTTERQAVIDPGGTDIATAVRLALSTFPSGCRRRIVLATDGNANRGDALAEIEAARAQGVGVDILPVRYRHEREISVERVLLPESVQEGVPFQLGVAVRSTAASRARLTVRRDGLAVSRHELELRPGRNLRHLPVRVDPPEDGAVAGLAGFEIEVEPLDPDDDRIAANNRGDAFARVIGPPTVLYIDGNLGVEAGYEPKLHAALLRQLRLLARQGGREEPEVRLHLVSADRIPSPEALAGYDCILLDNIPAEALGAERMLALRALVNDQGVGLVMIGGERSFAAGNYRKTPVEEALPVEMDLKNKRVVPNGALAVILHTCEFADGNGWAKKITQKAIDSLSDGDLVGVLYYGGMPGGAFGDGWLFELQPAVKRDELKSRVARCEPADMPAFDPTVRLAVEALRAAKAAVKHIIIISDGDPSPPSPETQKLLRETKQLTLSAISIGSHSSQSILKPLAEQVGGGRFYDVTDPRKLPQIFLRESLVIRRSLFFEREFVPVLLDPRDEFIAPVAGAPLRPLHGYIATTLKPSADAPLIVEERGPDGGTDRNPVLAHWRYGLGQAVAFTSDAKNRWGRDWLGWEKFGDFWGEIVYRILREPAQNLRLSAAVEGERGRIAVQAFDESGRPLSGLDLEAAVSTPSGRSLRIRLRQTGPAAYEGDFPADEPGRYPIAVRAAPGAGAVATAYGGLSVPHGAEWSALEADEPALHRMAEKGGGRVLGPDPAKAEVFRRDLPPSRDFRELWSVLVALAAILFPLDVFVRRVAIDWGTLLRRMRGHAAAAPARKDERMDRLRTVKREAASRAPAFLEPPAKTGPSQPEAPREPGAPPPAAPADEPVAESYTGRLLAAKKRARERK